MRAREWRKRIEILAREHSDLASQLIIEGETLKKEKELEADVHLRSADALNALLREADPTDEEEDDT